MRGPDSDTELAVSELPAMTVWPSIAAFPLGRKIGQLCAISTGIGKFFTVGKLMAIATIPLSLGLFFWRLAPGVARRYTLTNKRILIRKGLGAVEAQSIGLEDFDSVTVEVLPGQEFLRAGDLVFRAQEKETFRLPGIQHPEGFRQACIRGQQAMLGVLQVVAEQAKRLETVGTAGNHSS